MESSHFETELLVQDLEELLQPKDSAGKVLTVKNEDTIAEAIFNWILFEEVQRKEHLERLCKLVNFSIVTQECLVKFQENFPNFNGMNRGRSHII